MTDNGADEGFVQRTYRSAAFVTTFVLFTLAAYAQFWALGPVLAGAALGLGLLYTMDWFVRRTFTVERMEATKKKGRGAGPGRALLALALVKYPLVGLALWLTVRFWDLHRVMAFAGGFALIQTVIGLRGVGRYVVDRMNESAAPRHKTAGRWKE